MTFYVEMDDGGNEAVFSGGKLNFDPERITNQVITEALEEEGCPYEVQVNLLLTDNEGIRIYNRDYRQVDRATDVLSFPAIPFRQPGDFSLLEEEEGSFFDPESGELLLGDVVISMEKVYSQAAEYGHSLKREFAFLLVHSLLHLCGYDHIQPAEGAEMEEKQEKILAALGIVREDM